MKRQSILKNVPAGKTFEVWGKKFPFKQREMNGCDIVRVACFRTIGEEN